MKTRFLVCAALPALLLFGCGGSDPGAPEVVGGRDTGALQFSVVWPERPSKAIPYAAEAIKVTITRQGQTTPFSTFTIVRPETSRRLEALEPGPVVVTAAAHGLADATDAPLATASGSSTIVERQTARLALDLVSTVSAFTVWPNPAYLYPDEEVIFNARATAADGTVLLIPDVTWTLVSGQGVIKLDTSRAVSPRTARVQALADGQATVKVSYAEAAGVSREVTATVTVGPTGLANSPWPMFRGGPRHTGRGKGSGAVGVKRWEFATGGDPGTTFQLFFNSPYPGSLPRSSPAIGADGTVYVGSHDNKVYAMDGATGAKKWEFATSNKVVSSPAIGADGTVYVGSYDGKVYALNGTTGTKKWEFATSSADSSGPSIGTDGTVYVGCYDGKLYALDGTTGTKKWESANGGAALSSPAIGVDGTVYVGSHDKKVYALDGATGAKKWEFATGGEVLSSPAIDADGTVYVGSWDQKVYALDGATGAKKWEFATGDAVISSPAIGADGTVYVGSSHWWVYALDGATGAQEWQFKTGNDVMWSSPAIGADGTVYVGSADKKVYALDGATGARKWEFATGDHVSSSPAIGPDGTVYVGSWDGKLYAIW